MPGPLFLFCAALLWGISFYPQKVSTESLGALWACSLRFLMAIPFVLFAARNSLPRMKPKEFRGAVLCGTLLCGAFALQTLGIVKTDISRVSLITGLYAAFVPVFAPLFGLPRPTRRGILALLIGLVGMVLLVDIFEVGGASVPPNLGDVLAFAAAFFTVFHVLTLGRVAPGADGWAVNGVQVMTMFFIITALAYVVDGPPNLSAVSSDAWWSLLFLAVMSSTIAFAFQAIGQQTTPPTTAALIMLLEAPFGVLCAVSIADETLSALQGLGAVLLLTGVGLSVIADADRRP